MVLLMNSFLIGISLKMFECETLEIRWGELGFILALAEKRAAYGNNRDLEYSPRLVAFVPID